MPPPIAKLNSTPPVTLSTVSSGSHISSETHDIVVKNNLELGASNEGPSNGVQYGVVTGYLVKPEGIFPAIGKGGRFYLMENPSIISPAAQPTGPGNKYVSVPLIPNMDKIAILPAGACVTKVTYTPINSDLSPRQADILPTDIGLRVFIQDQNQDPEYGGTGSGAVPSLFAGNQNSPASVISALDMNAIPAVKTSSALQVPSDSQAGVENHALVRAQRLIAGVSPLTKSNKLSGEMEDCFLAIEVGISYTAGGVATFTESITSPLERGACLKIHVEYVQLGGDSVYVSP